MKTSVYNLAGKAVSEIELPDHIFAVKWNPDLVHQIVVAQAANLRKPWAHAKGRGEVRGGGRKPWKQKHTGRARQGSIRSPIWKGGGVSHGPVKTRIYAQRINKKMLRAALYAVLSKRLRNGELKVVDALPSDVTKTKVMAQSLRPIVPTLHALLVPATQNKMIYRASRNLPHVEIAAPGSLSVTQMLQYKHILLDQGAVAVLSKMK